MKLVYAISLFFCNSLSAQSFFDTADKRFVDFKKNVEYIINNPASVNSLRFLNYHFPSLKYDEGLKYYNRLDSKLVEEKEYKELTEKVSLAARSKPETPIKSFQLKDLHGNWFLFDSIIKSHKLVLLDFWGSWCASCREKAGFLKNLYGQYSSEGFSILSISVKEPDTIKWIQAIDKDGIGMWHHGLSSEDEMQTRLGVKDVPVYILVDNNMKILGRYSGQIPSLYQLELAVNKFLRSTRSKL